MLIGERLRQLREHKGFGQADVEQASGLLQCYISRVEHGHTVPSLETLVRFAAAFDVPLYRLFYTGEDTPPTPNLTPRKTLEELAQDPGTSGAEARLLLKLKGLVHRTYIHRLPLSAGTSSTATTYRVSPAKTNRMLNSSNHSLFPLAEFQEENLHSGHAWRNAPGISEAAASLRKQGDPCQSVYSWMRVASSGFILSPVNFPAILAMIASGVCLRVLVPDPVRSPKTGLVSSLT